MTTSAVDTYISDGNITLFFGSHSCTFKEDILYSSLLGQLSSNVKSTTADSWLHLYKKTLGSIFWTTKSDTIQTPSVKSASLLKLAKLCLQNYLSATEIDLLTQSLSNIKQLPSDGDIMSTLVNKIQHRDIGENQPATTTCPLLTIVRKDKMIISLFVSFETTEAIGISVLDEELTLKKPFNPPRIYQWVTYLGEDNYASVRHAVIEKLGVNTKTKLMHLDSLHA
ncbi:TPA: hypothetical protein SAN82_004300 [Pseudomonas putida]|nr:hypothetical protein [Pseudomonas putida]